MELRLSDGHHRNEPTVPEASFELARRCPAEQYWIRWNSALNMFRMQNADVVTLLAAPSLAHQRSSRSDIFEHWYDRVFGLKQLFELRRCVQKFLRRSK